MKQNEPLGTNMRLSPKNGNQKTIHKSYITILLVLWRPSTHKDQK